MSEAEPRPVIVDTDPGLDDALAILLALASPELQVRGLTTVAGNLGLEVTTLNALKLLHLASRDDIPVVTGADRPLRREPISVPDVHGNDGLGGVHLRDASRRASEGAVGWMAREIEAAPEGAIEVLALGPLTNVARLIGEHPSVASRLKRIVAMGGAIREPGNKTSRTEFNMASDPEAAAAVFASGLPVVLIPLDVTRRIRADLAWAQRLAQAGRPVAQASAAFVEAYFTATTDSSTVRESRPLHDPCVTLFAAAPWLFGTEVLRLRVETEGEEAGWTREDERGQHVEVALAVDAPAALDVLAARLASL
jgi:purine nucleosidase/pyrimidine-specific ribonucleoside hydrolase